MARTLYRRRFVPMETVELKDDEVLLFEKDRIVTRWKTLKPRKDIASGISAFFIPEGIKVSKIFAPDGSFVYWYCDMIQTVFDGDSVIFEDLLIDVIIDPDGRVHVVDAGEAADALRDGIISPEMLCRSLSSMDMLLAAIDRGEFGKFSELVEKFE